MSIGKFRVIVWRAGAMADPQLLKLAFDRFGAALVWAEKLVQPNQIGVLEMGRPLGYTIVVEIMEDSLVGPAGPPAKDPPNSFMKAEP